MTQRNRFNSLAFKQAKTVFLVSVALGLCFSFYQILLELHQEQLRVSEEYRFELLQNYSNASQAAYHLNHLLAEQVTTRLMTDPAIFHVKITDDFGDILSEKDKILPKQNSFIAALSQFLTPSNPIYQADLHQPNSNIVVGQLTFSVDGSSIARKFMVTTNKIILFDLLRNIILTSILLFFFYYKLSKPLMILSRWVRSLETKKEVPPPPTQHLENELKELAETFHDMWKEREVAEEKLNQLAYYDSLTGLANRSLLLQTVEESIELSLESKTTGALFYLDLDRFKTINDSLGHDIGDNLIKAISMRIKAWLQPGYVAARIGGDEFAVLVPNLENVETNDIAQQLLALISNPYSVDDHQLYCTVSIGISMFPVTSNTNIEALRQADTALYRAKVDGRNNHVLYEPRMHAQVESFLETEKGLHEAINKGQLELYYQPQVNSEQKIVGVEALIRWNQPQKGLLPPGAFMPIAEETGQILPIGDWIIEQACYQYAQWSKEGVLPESFDRLAINISPLQFAQDSFVEHITDCLTQAGISGEHIELEITENLLLENIEKAVKKMAELKEHKLKISIDDFGTGYSSLRYLKHLSVDMLKIDRSFVTQLHINESDQAIVDTIIMTAHRLNLEMIAEGVEDGFELHALQQLGCHQFQGFGFDKPLTAEELVKRFAVNQYQVEPLVYQPEPPATERLTSQ